MNIGLVVAEYNYDITMLMASRAKEHADFLGVKIVAELKVPGVFDIPFALNKLLMRKDIDGAVAIGAVIEGETEHDEVIMNQTTRKILDLAINFGKPIGLGITGPGMSRLQAEDRIDRAKDAVETVVKLLKLKV